MGSMIGQPAYQQVRILHDQKHPRQGLQRFKIPFYDPALKAVRDYYRSGRGSDVLSRARDACGHLRPESKAIHNRRVLDQFERSRHAKRVIVVQPNRRYEAHIGDVEIRLRFDLSGSEGAHDKRILYHWPDVSIDSESARRTLEIAHWVLQQNGIVIPIRHLEYIDVSTGQVHRPNRRRSTTIRRLKQNAGIIATLWPTV